jgi:hypothetical protein
MTKGAHVPALTWTVAGLVNHNTDASAFTGTPALTTTAKSSSAAGNYPITITQGTLESKNYGFKFVNGNMKVNP